MNLSVGGDEDDFVTGWSDALEKETSKDAA